MNDSVLPNKIAFMLTDGLTQPSIVTWFPVIFRDEGLPPGVVIHDDPPKLNELPTSPEAYAGFPIHVPLLPPMMSSGVPSPGHQLIRFAGVGRQVGVGVGVGVGVSDPPGVGVGVGVGDVGQARLIFTIFGGALPVPSNVPT